MVVGGHTDSWDCAHESCQGAHDDGQGVIIAMEIIRLLAQYQYQPRRTIRAVLFVDEEVGQRGADAYQQAHQHEAQNVIAAIETDLGVGPVAGFGFSGTSEGRDTLRNLVLSPLSKMVFPNGEKELRIQDSWTGTGVDISPLIERDHIPGILLRHEDTWWDKDYFHFHHSSSDTIDHVDKKLLQQNLEVLLGLTWILANTDQRISR